MALGKTYMVRRLALRVAYKLTNKVTITLTHKLAKQLFE
jgi:hypothetical protein